MRTNRLNFLPLAFSSIVGLFFIFFMGSAMAAAKPIHCSTSFGEKQFSIQGESVAFVDSKNIEKGREISSVSEITKVRTHKSLAGFTKVLYRDGNKHKIVIKNTKSFDANEDFMTVISPKGHTMTYALNCQ